MYNPVNGELVSDKIPVAGEDDVNEAVDAANAAFAAGSPWRKMTFVQRREVLLKFADILEKNQERLAELTRVTLGAPYWSFGKYEIDAAVAQFRCER